MSESDKPDPWRVRKADGTEIRVPTRALLESWILAGVVEPDDRVARPGEDSYIRIRDLKDVSEAVETGSVVHGPRTVPTHPPVFAVVDGPTTAPPPFPVEDPEVIDLEPLEGDTIQDAPIVEDEEPAEGLELAKTRVAQVGGDPAAAEYPTESTGDPRRPPEGATLDEMLPSLEASTQPDDQAPRTGRVAVAPTNLAPLVVAGDYVTDQAIDPSLKPGSRIPHIDADGEIIERAQQAPRTGRIAVSATDVDAANREMELQSTYPERSAIPDATDQPTEPTIPQATVRPDVSLQASETANKPSALNQTLNKAPSAPATTEALSRPIHRAGALGGSYSEELEVRALQRERRRTVTTTVALLILVGAGVASWWFSQERSGEETQGPLATEAPVEVAVVKEPTEAPVAPPENSSPTSPEKAPGQLLKETGAAPADPAPGEAETPSVPAIEKTDGPVNSKVAETDDRDSQVQREAAETAREVASAAVDEELEADAKGLEVKPSKDKKSREKKAQKSGATASPSRGYASLIRAAKKLKRKQPNKALALYKQALAQRPSSVDALSNVGRLQMKSGKTSEALKTFKRCRSAAPRYTPCMYWHGRALEKAGRRSDAMKAYEKYLDVNPDGSLAVDVRKRLTR